MKKIIIAIDGYAGAGKSTTAKEVARQLKYNYVDSGAMYRAITLYFIRHQIALDDSEAVHRALEALDISFLYDPIQQKSITCLNGEDVEQEIRKMYVSDYVSDVSKLLEVRQKVMVLQLKLGESKGIVMDGRDIGSKVFPFAELKIFMIADLETRAARRLEELQAKGEVFSLEEIIENLRNRDQIDTTRKESPLVQAEDAILLDSTHISFTEQAEFVLNLARRKIEEYH
ncbi:MAG: (d)CMP kinase [Microscillaceae bacterium]|nr:(d)CMP kinase [Microscillaceae bacterium]